MTGPRPLRPPAQRDEERSPLIDELRAGCRGSVGTTAAELASVAFDFGAGATKMPRVVVRAADVADVLHVVRTAHAFGTRVTPRATAHTLAGQALSDGGIALDLRDLSRILRCNVDEGWMDVEAGAVWSDVVAAGLAYGRTPPILTSNLFTSVGGTHSVGGLGPTSFRYGVQTDHCLGLEVVTASGERVWCAPGERQELFDVVRCGLGLFGVMTRVRVAIASHPLTVLSWRLVYSGLPAMLTDLLSLAAEPLVCRLSGAGQLLDGSDRRCGWWIDVSIATEGNAPLHAPLSAHVLANLAPALSSGPHPRRLDAVVRSSHCTDLRRQTTVGAYGHPWVDLLLPSTEVAWYIRDALRTLPTFLLARSRILFWPVVRGGAVSPLFMMPRDEQVVLASIMPTVPRATMPEASPHMLALLDRGLARGGKQYVYGWLPQSQGAWARHFGPSWPAVVAAKQRHDPAGIFHPELLDAFS